MSWIARKLRFCIPLGRQERSARNEGTIVSSNLLQLWSISLDYEVATYVEGTLGSAYLLQLDNNMAYEELLELGERIGVQKGGLSEETISASLETKIVHIESSTSEDRNEETEICSICQAEYESGENVATLNCDHEYHVDCIKQWLRGKNACPICKRPAANTQPQMPSCAMIDHVPHPLA